MREGKDDGVMEVLCSYEANDVFMCASSNDVMTRTGLGTLHWRVGGSNRNGNRGMCISNGKKKKITPELMYRMWLFYAVLMREQSASKHEVMSHYQMNIFPVHAQSARNNHPPLFNPPLLPNNPNRYCFISTSFQTSPAAAASRDLPTCRFPATPTPPRDTDANIHNTTNTYRCVTVSEQREGGRERHQLPLVMG